MWFLLLIIAVVMIFTVVLLPLSRVREPWQPVPTSKAIELLQGQREQVMRKLKDLEAEKEADSIDEAEYQEMRATYLTEAALLGRRIAALEESAEDSSEDENQAYDENNF